MDIDFTVPEEDADIYIEEVIEDYRDSDAISAEEEGFMLGYLGA